MAGTRVVRVSGADDDRTIDRRQAADVRVALLLFLQDAVGNALGDPLAESRIADQVGLRAVGQEAAFAEDGGNGGIMGQAQDAADHAEIGQAGAADEVALDAHGETVAVRVPEKGVDPPRAAARGVVVDTDEDGVRAIAVGDGDAVVEFDEVVAGAVS